MMSYIGKSTSLVFLAGCCRLNPRAALESVLPLIVAVGGVTLFRRTRVTPLGIYTPNKSKKYRK